jgi:D-alanyl-lipoteichoic acid acyltransferase DltB (MBOAT superfamily)
MFLFKNPPKTPERPRPVSNGMKFRTVALLAVLALIPSAALAAAPQTLQALANVIVNLLDNATATLVVLGIVVYFYGVSTNILNFSDDGGEKLKAYFFWGIIVLFVMVSIWGILHILQDTLFGSGGDAGTASGIQGQSAGSTQSGVPSFSPYQGSE